MIMTPQGYAHDVTRLSKPTNAQCRVNLNVTHGFQFMITYIMIMIITSSSA